jgi:holo-[acyl-carrier protein] synthase
MKNVIGIGIDIVEIKRVAQKESVWKRFLTSNELDKANSFEDERKHEFIAGIWAAKEAILKASNGKKISYENIEIIKDEFGKPSAIVENKKDEYMISISHEKQYAVAIAMMKG